MSEQEIVTKKGCCYMKIREFFLLTLALLIWSGNVLVQKTLSMELSVLTLNLCRFSVLLPLVFFIKKPTNTFSAYIVTGFFWNVLNFVFQGYGWQSGVEASISSFLIQTNVFFSLLFSYLILDKKIKNHQMAGMILTSLGIFYLVFGDTGLHLTWAVGLIYLLLSAISGGLGFTLLQKYKFDGSLSEAIWICAASFITLLPISLGLEGPAGIWQQLTTIHINQWGGIIYGAVGSTAIASVIWLKLVKRHGPGLIMPFLLLLPGMTIVLSSIFWHEKLTPVQWIACCAMTGGVAVTQYPSLRIFWQFFKKRTAEI